jgi:hypothetical protein
MTKYMLAYPKADIVLHCSHLCRWCGNSEISDATCLERKASYSLAFDLTAPDDMKGTD